MLKKYSWLAILCAALLLTGSARAQEAELAANSNLTSASLPSGAARINEASVPSSVKEILSKFVAAGAGKIRQGDSEVLAWAGGTYKKSDAPRMMQQLQNTLQTNGWTYEIAGQDEKVVIFNLIKTDPTRRVIVGFFIPADEALVLAWTELLPINSSAPVVASSNANGAVANNASFPVSSNAGATSIPRELIGKWDTGNVSTALQYRDTVTGSTTPGRGSYHSYEFRPDGSFHVIGMLQSTVYNCTTTMFNEKAGRAEVNGSTITFIPTKNFWKKTNNCAPNSNMERDYTLEKETFQWQTKQDEYGAQLICLANNNMGERCFRRNKE